MSGNIEYNKWFNDSIKRIECGVELELLLFDSHTKEPVDSNSKTERILGDLPRQIYKDYYPYQLEIRTNPYSTPIDVVNETKKLYKETSKAFLRKGIYVVPVPSITKKGYVYCGMHIHLSYPTDRNAINYYKRAMGMYPFILSLADHTKNLETSDLETSERLTNSHHIGIPHLNQQEFVNADSHEHKMRDIIYSGGVRSDDNRSQMKKPATIEIRMLDTPSLFSFYEFMVYFTMNLAGRIRTNNPMVSQLEDNSSDIRNKIDLTRRLLSHSRYGVNKIFRMLNSDVCEDMCSYFNINFPRETQFEYRERLGLSASTNGYLSMAIKGGWI